MRYYRTHVCITCGKKTEKYMRVNGSGWFCYDGCYSTTGWDRRTVDGKPAWLGGKLISGKEF